MKDVNDITKYDLKKEEGRQLTYVELMEKSIYAKSKLINTGGGYNTQ